MSARVCDMDGCTSPHLAKGLCSKHYGQTPERKAATAEAMARYLATDAGRAARARYMASAEGKASVARYRATDRGHAMAERRWAKTALRRATKAGAIIGDIPADTRAILLACFGETCLVDGCENVATDVDHVIALADGGVHDISNFQTLCGSCNRSKRAKDTDYRPRDLRPTW